MDSQKMVEFIKENKGYDEKKAIRAAYQTRLFISSLKYLIPIAVALGLMGYLKETIIIFIAMKFYRENAGGVHIKNGAVCFITTLTSICGIILASKYFNNTVLEIVLLIYIIAIWYIYVPQGTSQRPLRHESEKQKMKKTMAILIIITIAIWGINIEVFRLCLWSLVLTVSCTTPVAYRITRAKYDRM